MRVSDLTGGEKVFLARTRKSVSKAQVAKEMGIPLWKYNELESDKDVKRPKVALGKLTKTEVYRIHRRRSGKTVKELAKLIGCSPEWYRRMEACKVANDKLDEFWK